MTTIEAILPEAIGFTGAFLFLLSYALLQTGKMKAEGVSYSLLNLVAALFILISLTYAWNTSAAFMEISWMTLSLYGLYKCTLKARFKHWQEGFKHPLKHDEV